MYELSQSVVSLLKEYHLTLSTAESCTGGWIAKSITDIPGASSVFPGGIVSYCDSVKMDLLSVEHETLVTDTAVSEACAKEMAIGVARKMNTHFGIATTGYAGPDDAQTGLVFVALATGERAMVRELHLTGSREDIRRQTVAIALEWMKQILCQLGESLS